MFVIDDLATLATTIINKLFPDKSDTEKQQLALKMQQVTQEYNLVQAQLDINKAEASHQSIFVAGWRPSIGWCCSIIFASNYFLIPVILNPLLHALGQPYVPSIPIGDIMPVLMAMLGFGGLRTFERVSGAIPKGK